MKQFITLCLGFLLLAISPLMANPRHGQDDSPNVSLFQPQAMPIQTVQIVEFVNQTLTVEERIVDQDGVLQLDDNEVPKTKHFWAPLSEVKFTGQGLSELEAGSIKIEALRYRILLEITPASLENTDGFNTPLIRVDIGGVGYNRIKDIYPMLKEL
jgi:hypothetical protein